MKTSSFVAAFLFASVASLSVSASAADTEKSETKPAEMQMVNKAKPHSHVQEKTGVPQTMPMEDMAKPNPANDKTRHNHQRDMK